MFHYQTHGINIQSQIPITELPQNDGFYDIKIIKGRLELPDEFISKGKNFILSKDALYLFWDDVGIFKLIKGQKVIVDVISKLSLSTLKEVLLGPVMAYILHQRGKLILHASAVEINNQAVAFIGFTGAGKSSIARALYNKGYGVITDDILAVDLDKNDNPQVYSSFPYLKLSDEVHHLFEENNHKYSSLEIGKPFRKFSQGFNTTNFRLTKIFVLQSSSFTNIQCLSPQDSFIELIRNSYCSKIFESQEQSHNFKQCSNLAEKVSINILNVEKSLKKLFDVADLVETNVKKSDCNHFD